MTKVSCRQKRCVNWSAGRCSAESILLDGAGVCVTQDEEDTEADVLDVQAEDWEGEELDDTFNEEDDEDWEDEEDWPEEDDDELDEDDEEDWPDDEWVSDRWRKP